MFRSMLPMLVVTLGADVAIAGEPENVLGGELNTCSKPGMALTGFTRDGHCQDEGDDDAGSHHICIQMKEDFCRVTGQPNWCGDSMECMEQEGTLANLASPLGAATGTSLCPIGNWCVCQWAFARYIEMAGGCDSIVDLVCDATNMAALRAYKADAGATPGIKKALECIQEKCPSAASDAAEAIGKSDASVPALKSPTAEAKTQEVASNEAVVPASAMCLLAAFVILAAVVARLHRGSGQSQQDVYQEATTPE